jgi:hypothetical protein
MALDLKVVGEAATELRIHITDSKGGFGIRGAQLRPMLPYPRERNAE